MFGNARRGVSNSGEDDTVIKIHCEAHGHRSFIR